MTADERIPARPLPVERRVALVVATSHYADREEYPYLAAPAQDAQNMKTMLADPQICGFEVSTLVDAPSTAIRPALETIFHDERDADDLVLVYLSCHGVRDRRGRLHFVTTDTSRDGLRTSAVAARELMDLAEECPARRKVIILDCCFSGAFDAKSVAVADILVEQPEEAMSGGLCVLTASRAAEFSFQDRLASGEVTGSVFTSALIEGIRTGRADVANNGRITVQDAYRYAHAAVISAGRRQNPRFNIKGAEGAGILLARNPIGIRAGDPDLYELVGALDSRHAEIRIAAVRTFGNLLHDENPARSTTARQNLERLASSDDDELADLARNLLVGGRRRRRGPVVAPDEPIPPSPPVQPAPDDAARFIEDSLVPTFTEEELEGLAQVRDPLGVFSSRVLPLEDEPTAPVARYLYPTERFRAEWRRHWSDPIVAIALCGLASGLAWRGIDPDRLALPERIGEVSTDPALTGLLVAVAVLAGWRALAWHAWRVAFTNKRIVIVRGILWRRTASIPLEGVTGVRTSSSPLGSLFGYGTLTVSGARWLPYRIRHLPYINELLLRILEEIHDPESVEARLGYGSDEDD